ncbi:hypothetical protein MRX96_023759 [Rhipicephalus microplus]
MMRWRNWAHGCRSFQCSLWEDGWRERYYVSKFDIGPDNIAFRHDVASAYVEGLCWVLRYYYQGCASWKWFFPYHYAPFASDFINVGDLNIEFERGTQPFKPMEQLMSVFPAASKQHLPLPWADLMDDPDSPIIDFYPTDFKIDLNGKKYAWQGVALLPFVDEKRLLETVQTVYPHLTEDERKRNTRGDDDYNMEFDLEPKYFSGIGGKILLSHNAVGPGDDVRSVIPGLEDIPGNMVVCVRFRDPKYADDFVFPAVRLPGATEPQRVLKPGDLSQEESRNWRPQIGMAPRRHIASLSDSGRRMIGHAVASMGPYSQVAPPAYQNRNDRQSWGQGASGRGGYRQDSSPGSRHLWRTHFSLTFHAAVPSGDGYHRQHSSSGYQGGGGGGGQLVQQETRAEDPCVLVLAPVGVRSAAMAASSSTASGITRTVAVASRCHPLRHDSKVDTSSSSVINATPPGRKFGPAISRHHAHSIKSVYINKASRHARFNMRNSDRTWLPFVVVRLGIEYCHVVITVKKMALGSLALSRLLRGHCWSYMWM